MNQQEHYENMIEGYDPRAVANALLDAADSFGVQMSNLSLNKIEFFAHSDYLLLRGKPLVNLNFEAWQFGPVLPVVYHQFKHFGKSAITGRAFRYCPETGKKLLVGYADLSADLDFLVEAVERYGRLSPSALIQLSHAKGTPWDLVWNSESVDKFGLAITDDHIWSSLTFQATAERMSGDGRHPKKGTHYVN